jgi:hypothetical protein
MVIYMPTRNIYVKDSDLPLIERAEKELGESLSAMFADCLRSKLGPELPTTVERIKLDVGDPPITKVFQGRWLFGEGDGIKAEPDESGVTWSRHANYSAAQGKNGSIVIYTYDEYNEVGQMDIFGSFDELQNATDDHGAGYPKFPENVLAGVASALEIPFEVELEL